MLQDEIIWWHDALCFAMILVACDDLQIFQQLSNTCVLQYIFEFSCGWWLVHFCLLQPKCIVLKKAPNKCSTETNILTTGIFKLLKVRTRTICHSSIFKQFMKRKVQQNRTHTSSASVTREPCTQKMYFTLCFAMNCCRSKQNSNVGMLIEIAFRIAIHMLLCTS